MKLQNITDAYVADKKDVKENHKNDCENLETSLKNAADEHRSDRNHQQKQL